MAWTDRRTLTALGVALLLAACSGESGEPKATSAPTTAALAEARRIADAHVAEARAWGLALERLQVQSGYEPAPWEEEIRGHLAALGPKSAAMPHLDRAEDAIRAGDPASASSSWDRAGVATRETEERLALVRALATKHGLRLGPNANK